MKLMKRKNDTSTLRKVWSDDKTQPYGAVGTVRDLLQSGILEWCDYPPETWLFISACPGKRDRFGKTREEALAEIESERKEAEA